MAEMAGAQALFEMLVRGGVRYVFGNPGTSELPLMDLFAARDEIQYVLALHEDSAVGMAAGYADAAGEAAVVNLHTNPGVAHGLGNLYNAYRAGTPLVVTAGQQHTRMLIDEPLLTADLVTLVRQHTKWAWEVHHAAEIPAAMARAFKIALTPPTGPVFVSLPVNAMEERAEMELPPITRVGSRVRADRALIEEAARVLAAAHNPVIITGDGCARSGAVSAVAALAETLGARVHTEPLNALLDFPTGHRLYAGPLFANAQQTQKQLADADVILTVGVNTLTPLVYTGVAMIPAGAKLIQIHADGHELGKNFPAELAILADPRAAIGELTETLAAQLSKEATGKMAQRREKIIGAIAAARAKFAEQSVAAPDGGPVPPAYLARELRAAAAPDAVIVDEAVTATAFIRTLFELNEPGSYFFAKGGSLGLGLPAGIGVKLARPNQQVICTVGDGSALYSIQALWTAARYRVEVVFVIFNNASYVILKGGLLAMQGASVERGIYTGMDIDQPTVDFVRLAESMGVAARRVSQVIELRPALDWALAESAGQGQPKLLDVAVTANVRSLLR
jgi:benzoylformate decarboxylase